MKSTAMVCLAIAAKLGAQGPYIGQTTINPHPVTTSDPVQILTHVVTPHLGKGISRNITVNALSKSIVIGLCKWSGMLTATQTYIDTFSISALPAGGYSVIVNFSISGSDQSCQPLSANSSTTTFTVSQISSFKSPSHKPAGFSLYPSPATAEVFVSAAGAGTVPITLRVFDALGREVMSSPGIKPGGPVDVSHLRPGLYVVRVDSGKETTILRFLKN